MKIQSQQLTSNKKGAKRVGRGISAGGGKTAGRGTKGQKSRAGHNIPRQFEGGQSNLSLRLPKTRGFRRHVRAVAEISLAQLDAAFKAGDKVSNETLIKAGLLRIGETAKILNNGEITKKLEIVGVNISKGAQKAIESVKTAKVDDKKTVEDKASDISEANNETTGDSKTAKKAPAKKQSK